MRMSDWSSDVCSSDLADREGGKRPACHQRIGGVEMAALEQPGNDRAGGGDEGGGGGQGEEQCEFDAAVLRHHRFAFAAAAQEARDGGTPDRDEPAPDLSAREQTGTESGREHEWTHS